MKWPDKDRFPHFSSDSDVPVKLIFVLLYILGAVLIWRNQERIFLPSEDMEYLSPVAAFVLQNSFKTYLFLGGSALTMLIFTPLDKKFTQEKLKSIGLCNHAGTVPQPKRKHKSKDNPRITIREFTTEGIPLKVWEDMQAAIETVLNITIVKMEHGDGKSRILLHTVPARSDLPKAIDWNDKYLSKETFALALGESFTGPVTIDLTNIPHVLLGGSTGSGKSVLLKLILMQSVRKGGRGDHFGFQRRCGLSISLAQILPDVLR